MNRIVSRICEKHKMSLAGIAVQEALADHERYLTTEVIEYMYAQLEDPATRKSFLDRVRKYHTMSELTSDKVTALMYEYLRYLPPEMAKNFAREFYQKEVRNKVYDNLDSNDEDEASDGLVNTNKWYDVALEAGNPDSDIGMFAAYSDGDFEEDLESEDIFNVLLNGNILSRDAKILLITNLMFGTGPGMRAKGGEDETRNLSMDSGLDLKQILKTLPPEYKVVEDKIKELQDKGFKLNRITPKAVLSGDFNDDENNKIFVTGLLGKNRPAAQKELIEKVTDLADELGLNTGAIFGESFTDDVEKGDEKTKDKMFLIWLDRLLSGGKLSGSQLITVIVRAVASNLNRETQLSKKSKRFKFDGVARIAREYLKLMKRGSDENVSEVQAMVLAPVLSWKLKDKKL